MTNDIMNLSALQCAEALTADDLWATLQLDYGDVEDNQDAYEQYILAHALYRTMNLRVANMTEAQAQLFWSTHVPDHHHNPFPFWLFADKWSC